MLKALSAKLISRAERRLGVALDYVRDIAVTDTGLLMRYNRIFGFLDPRKHVPKDAYHAARIRGALAADCGTCVEVEVNLARHAGLPQHFIAAVMTDDLDGMDSGIIDTIALTDAVVLHRNDDPDARERLVQRYGKAGLIELAYAMNGAAMIPGIKRAMGYAVACDSALMTRLTRINDSPVPAK